MVVVTVCGAGAPLWPLSCRYRHDLDGYIATAALSSKPWECMEAPLLESLGLHLKEAVAL